MFYRIEDVFFSFDSYEFESGKLKYSQDPTDVSTISSIDRGFPVISLRDSRTITHIFNIEVDLGSEDYKALTRLYKETSEYFRTQGK